MYKQAAYKQLCLTCVVYREASVIVVAYVGSTFVVLLWLIYAIEVNLKENEEDAEGGTRPMRVSELLKVFCLRFM